jgi:hypothetical protein
MAPPFREWLEELEQEPPQLLAERGSGGRENLWTISWPSGDADEDARDWVAFLRSACEIRRRQVAGSSLAAVFYAWHDEQAGNLCFSIARGDPADVPFRARIALVGSPDPVVASFLSSPHRDGIPFSELSFDAASNGAEGAETRERWTVEVWAVGL